MVKRKNQKTRLKDRTLFQQGSAIRERFASPKLGDDLQGKILSSGLLVAEQEFTSIEFNQVLVKVKISQLLNCIC